MAISDDDIRDFFTRYGNSLGDFDAETSASLWGAPGMILTDDFAGTTSSREELVAGLKAGYPMYQALGLASVAIGEFDATPITDRISSVRVRWLFSGDDGEVMIDGSFVYVIRRDVDGILRAYVSVGIDEEEKIAALAEEKGVDLSQFGPDGA